MPARWTEKEAAWRRRILHSVLSMLADLAQDMERLEGRHVTRLEAVRIVRSTQAGILHKFRLKRGKRSMRAYRRLINEVLRELEHQARN